MRKRLLGGSPLASASSSDHFVGTWLLGGGCRTSSVEHKSVVERKGKDEDGSVEVARLAPLKICHSPHIKC